MNSEAVNPKCLKNRDQIDLLEAYLGDCASYFEWKNEGYVSSCVFGICSDMKGYVATQVKIFLRLRDYPSDKATIIAQWRPLGKQYNSNGKDYVFAEAWLSDPEGMEFINKKVKSAIFVFKGFHREEKCLGS